MTLQATLQEQQRGAASIHALKNKTPNRQTGGM